VLKRVAVAQPPRRPRLVTAPALPSFTVQSFGLGQVIAPDGTAVEWARETARELFFYLLLNGTTKSHRAVADLWPNADSAQGKASLYSAVYAVRRAIHPEAIVAVERTYSLRPELVGAHDAADFDRLYAESRTETSSVRRLALLQALVDLHTGPLLDGFSAEWVIPLRQTRELRYLDALEALVSGYAAVGAWDACLEASLKGLELDPDTEAFYEHASRSYRALGKPWSATRITRRARDRAVNR
jgi:two-component SAPR family response regulator